MYLIYVDIGHSRPGILNNASNSTEYNRLPHNDKRCCLNAIIADT